MTIFAVLIRLHVACLGLRLTLVFLSLTEVLPATLRDDRKLTQYQRLSSSPTCSRMSVSLGTEWC